MDAMTSTTAPAQAPADQLAAAQQANTRLIARIVDLEHERDAALRVVATAVSLVSYAEGVRASAGGLASDWIPEAVYQALAAAVAAWQGEAAPPSRGRCDHCTLPLVAGHIADEVVITNGARRAHVHRACASAYPGWDVVIRARGV